MSKRVTKIVLTGGPAAGKTTLVSRVLKEFKKEDGWRVITIPESATELISGFGLAPFGECMSMLAFQDFVTADQLHKEKLALNAVPIVPEENILILYDRAVLDNRAYISDEDFTRMLARVDGRTPEQMRDHYDAVLHLVTCAKGAEFAYNLGNAARTESLEYAREMDDRTLRAWSGHPNLRVIDNSVNFEEKINRAIREICRIVGQPEPVVAKHKYLIEMPDMEQLAQKYAAAQLDMMQTYLRLTQPGVERRVRQQRSGDDYLYFYTDKHTMPNGQTYVTEKPISEKEYIALLMEGDPMLHAVHKTKYRFIFGNLRWEIDVYPFSTTRAVLFVYSDETPDHFPEGIQVLQEITGDLQYKNRTLAQCQSL